MRTFSLAFLLALLGAAYLISGRYATVAAEQNGNAILFVTDRFSGTVSICGVAGCRRLPTIATQAQQQ